MIQILRFLKLYSIPVLVLTMITGCGQRIANFDSKGESIVCFGDSITEGVGADRNESYPSLLSERIKLEVINSGVRGHTTRDALKRIKEDVLAHNPKMVIVAFGGNDFLQKIPKEETLSNLNQIVSTIQQDGAMVLLAGVRIGILRNEYASIYKKVARQHKTLLIVDLMDGIMDKPQYKYDQIHPNADGYLIIADRIYQTIHPFIKEN